MSKNKNVHVVPHKSGGWATKSAGAGRAGSIHSTQREAISQARSQAIRHKLEVVIHRKNGQIRDKDSYGNDPFPPRDKKH
jgi:hypothetical protein